MAPVTRARGPAPTTILLRRSRSRAALPAAAVLLAASGVGAVAGAPVAGATSGTAQTAQTAPTREDTTIPVGPEPGGAPVALDAAVFVPGDDRPPAGWPSVVLAHGYGGSKDDLADQADDLARRGYVVATYTARGFGASGGRIHLGAPEHEGADVRAVVDVLAARPDVGRDDGGDPSRGAIGGSDPVVGVAGASYGGAAALLAEGTDPRVDAVAAAITWNDLASSLTPQSASVVAGDDDVEVPEGPQVPGVLKSAWVGQLLRPSAPSLGADGEPVVLPPGATSQRPGCGRLAEDFCSAYLETLEGGGVPTPALTALLEASSPARVLDGASAPALLVQGEADTLFGLEASLANAAQLRAAGAPVTVAWSTGGHDALGALAGDFRVRTREFFAEHLVPRAERAGESAGAGGGADGAAGAFTYALPLPAVAAFAGDGGGGDGAGDDDGAPGRGPVAPLRTQDVIPAPEVPAAGSAEGPPVTALPLAGEEGAPRAQPLLFPPGGVPAARTSIPGVGVLSTFPGLGAGSVVPGQSAVFTTEPLAEPLSLAGPASVDLSVAAPSGSAVLFAALYDVDADGAAVLPGGGVAPLRVRTGEVPALVRADLPVLAREVPAGHRLRLVVASTDAGYAMPVEPAPYTVAVAGDLRVTGAAAGNAAAAPLESVTTVPTAQVVVAAVLTAAAVVGAAVLAVGRRRARRRGAAAPSPGTTPGATGGDDGAPGDVVLAVEHLVLEYRGGVRAVDDASFTVRRGQVVGLLGPNGAGKTTVLRVVLGLVRPTEGSVEVLGTPVVPGAAVLSRVGALVEGTGFLPHLSGRENLELFWRATGRPAADAHLDEALAVADLGDRVERRVGTYSQGMRMRLGIAAALLGLPELLVLDEPTNGLDPPQITAMRAVLRDYAASGRTVIVSSHLLAEVEATCSHVVVMARGAVLAQGSVADLVGTASAVRVGVGPGQVPRALDAVRELAPGLDAAGAEAGERAAGGADDGAGEDQLVVSLGPGDAAPGADDVVAALVRAGVSVRAVVPQRHLEQVFLELVGGQ